MNEAVQHPADSVETVTIGRTLHIVTRREWITRCGREATNGDILMRVSIDHENLCRRCLA